MEDLKIRDVQIRPDSIRSALKSLDEAIRTHTEMRQLLERLLRLQGGKPRGRPAAAGRVVGGGRRGRRPGGGKTLRQAIVGVLKGSKRPLRPVELRNRILASGYQTTATSQSFYTAVFNTASKEPGVVKTSAGFRLRGSGATARRKKKKKKKKTARKGVVRKAGTRKKTRKKAS